MGDRGTSDGLGESVPERKWWVRAGGVSLPLPPTGHFLSWGHPAGPGAASHPSPHALTPIREAACCGSFRPRCSRPHSGPVTTTENG